MVHFIMIYPVHLKVIWAVHLKCCNQISFAGHQFSLPDDAILIGKFVVIYKMIRQRFIPHPQLLFTEIVGQDFQVTEILMLVLIL